MKILHKGARVTFLALICLAAAVSTARAETRVGIRGGLSVDPDQVLVGLSFQPPAIAQNLYIVPNIEAGFGDDLFSLAFNGDLQYQFGHSGGVRPYAGGGLALTYWNADNGGDDTELGVNALGGLLFDRSSGAPIFLEMKLGLSDEVPDFKFVVGLMFR
jgi:hypothetical protein